MLELLTVKELSAKLKIGEGTIYKLVRTKKITGHKIGGLWRFRPEEVLEVTKPKEETTHES